MSATFGAAATGGLLALNPGLDNIGSAADSGGDTNGAGRTIPGTCTAFHTSIKIIDCGFFAVHSKDTVGADVFTNPAANTRLLIKLQGCYPCYISKILHFQS